MPLARKAVTVSKKIKNNNIRLRIYRKILQYIQCVHRRHAATQKNRLRNFKKKCEKNVHKKQNMIPSRYTCISLFMTNVVAYAYTNLILYRCDAIAKVWSSHLVFFSRLLGISVLCG